MGKIESLFNNSPIGFIEAAPNPSFPIYPLVFGYEKCSPKKKPIVYDKDCFTIHFVINGSGHVKTNKGGETRIADRSCFFFLPHCKSLYYPDKKSPWSYFWVEFSGGEAKKMILENGLIASKGCSIANQFPIIVSIFEALFAKQKTILNKSSSDLVMQSSLLSILALLIEELGIRKDIDGGDISPSKADDILFYIEKNYADSDLSIASISSYFHYSPSYLCHLLKKRKGISPSSYIRKTRMKYAAAFLEKRNMPIKMVSLLVGYKNQFYFSKQFLSYYGVRPSRYRTKFQ